MANGFYQIKISYFYLIYYKHKNPKSRYNIKDSFKLIKKNGLLNRKWEGQMDKQFMPRKHNNKQQYIYETILNSTSNQIKEKLDKDLSCYNRMVKRCQLQQEAENNLGDQGKVKYRPYR